MSTSTPDDPRWYQDVVVYALDVGTFQDSNGDGVGDFAGLTSRLDYLAGEAVVVAVDLPATIWQPTEVFANRSYPAGDDPPRRVALDAYGCRWFRLTADG